MPANNSDTEKKLWEAADELRANSRLKASEYSPPVQGLIFLRQADYRFAQAEQEMAAERAASLSLRAGLAGVHPRGAHALTPDDFHARGVVYLPPEARFARLLGLPEGENIGRAVNAAMRAIEAQNPNLADALPKTYIRLESTTLSSLLKTLNSVPVTQDGDIFGRIYEYFLAKFAMTEGQRGGEFFTPTTLVQLIVEVIEPFYGRICDPASGSGGMFVQSGRFVRRHRQNPSEQISVYGQERIMETVRLCRRNLAVHGLEGNIRLANSYYEDAHRMTGRADFVMSNPPFNVNRIDKERIKDDRRRFPFGMPTVDNGNYIWIQIFYSLLNERGRAGFVMANSATDARGSELEIRRQLIQAGAVDVMMAIASNFFYTVTLPCTLWFLDRGKAGTPRADKVLFVDARHVYMQVDRAHREFAPEQVEFLGNIARLFRGEAAETGQGSGALMEQYFPGGVYRDVAGLCKVATLAEIETQGWSLNPGRYVGVAEGVEEEFDFAERFQGLNEELEALNAEAHGLEEQIGANVEHLLEQVQG